MVKEEKEIKALREADPIKAYPNVKNLLMVLIQELSKMRDANYISIQKRDFSITLQKG